MPQFRILFYANYTILMTQKGCHGQMGPLNTPLALNVFCTLPVREVVVASEAEKIN